EGWRKAYSLAVAAGAVKLAKVLDMKARDGDGSNAVVLNDLVLSALSAASSDGTSTVTLEGQSVLANGLPPNIGNCASTNAVYA
nr:hypothetical protein [Tanacetum cinerariifolium]